MNVGDSERCSYASLLLSGNEYMLNEEIAFHPRSTHVPFSGPRPTMRDKMNGGRDVEKRF